MSYRLKNKLAPYAFLLIPLALYLIWIIGPMIFTFYLSLTNWDGLSLAQAKFIGLSNYQRLFDDDIFSISLANNIKWILVFITVPTTAGLALALALNRSIPAEKFFKISFYLPLVLATSVAAIIWSWLFNPSTGLINSFLALSAGLLAISIPAPSSKEIVSIFWWTTKNPFIPNRPIFI
jgi:multiple sugar transport system permease protein